MTKFDPHIGGRGLVSAHAAVIPAPAGNEEDLAASVWRRGIAPGSRPAREWQRRARRRPAWPQV